MIAKSTEPSPRPWKAIITNIDPTDSQCSANIVSSKGKDDVVATLRYSGRKRALLRLNAAHIEKCVNEHDNLKSMLRNAAYGLRHLSQSGRDDMAGAIWAYLDKMEGQDGQ